MTAPGWIDLPTAAKRSGRSVGHLARQCRDKFKAVGMAKQDRDAAGKTKAEWFVKEEADPAFAAVKFPEQIGTDLTDVPKPKRDEAARRLKILHGWDDAKRAAHKLGFNETAATGRFLEQLLINDNVRLSRATLYNWYKRWRQGGLRALVDGRGDRDADEGLDPFLEEVKRLFLLPRRIKLTVCVEMAGVKADEQGWAKKHYRTCARAVEAIPRAVVLKQRFGGEAFTNEAEPFLQRDYTTLASNEIWCGDHHQFDVIVLDEQGKPCRPWVTAWQDMRSRKIVGYAIFTHAPNSDTILRALVDAMHPDRRDAGVPQSIYIDNGKDYDAYVFQGLTKQERRRVTVGLDSVKADGIFPALGIRTLHAPPYHPQSKPIERFFGTLETRTAVWPTCVGRNPENKPHDLELQLQRGNVPKFADFANWFEQWLQDGYHAKPGHKGQGMDGRSPRQVWHDHLATKRTTTALALELALLRKTRPVRVAQNGVIYNGLRYGQYEPALAKLLGSEVILRVDDAHLGRVSVWTLDDRFVCVAPANQSVPANATSQQLREAIATKKRHSKLMKEYTEARPRMADDLPQLMLRAAAAKAKGAAPAKPTDDTPAGPMAIKPVRTGLEDQAEALQRAMQRADQRKAVGADGASFGDLGDALARRQQQEQGPRAAGGDDDPLLRLSQVFDDH